MNSTPSTGIGSDEGIELGGLIVTNTIELYIHWSEIPPGTLHVSTFVCPGHNGPESKETLLTGDTSNTDKRVTIACK